MPEVANCPLCGEAASIFRLDDDPVTFSHCGMQANSGELWNSYATAMELAIATAAYFTLATEAGHKRLQEAGQRVLEVFK